MVENFSMKLFWWRQQNDCYSQNFDEVMKSLQLDSWLSSFITFANACVFLLQLQALWFCCCCMVDCSRNLSHTYVESIKNNFSQTVFLTFFIVWIQTLLFKYLAFLITSLDADELKLCNKNNLAWLSLNAWGEGKTQNIFLFLLFCFISTSLVPHDKGDDFLFFLFDTSVPEFFLHF